MIETSREAQVREHFRRDVDRHVLEVKHDDGLYRHLRFKRPDSIACYFDLVTWPGHLCFCGDMGEFVFSRTPDMLEFFRQPEGSTISFGYWAEKCVAVDRANGLKEFDAEMFKEALERDLEGMEADAELREEARMVILPHLDDGKHGAIRAAMEFEWKDEQGKRTYPFLEFYEHSLDEYTHRFYWCCFAIVWGIARYDESRVAVAMAEGGG